MSYIYTLNSFSRNVKVKERRIRDESWARKRSRKTPKRKTFFLSDLRMFIS